MNMSPPDVVVVHPLKERIGLDVLHAHSSDPVLLLAAEPAHNTLTYYHTFKR